MATISLFVFFSHPSINGYFAFSLDVPPSHASGSESSSGVTQNQPTGVNPLAGPLNLGGGSQITNQTQRKGHGNGNNIGGGFIVGNNTAGLGNGGNGLPQFFGYRFLNFPSFLSLWSNGTFVGSPLQHYFQGLHQFMLYKNGVAFSKFNISFASDFDFNNIYADTDETLGKSLIYDPLHYFNDPTLYIPRLNEHTQVRVCPNTIALNEINQNCAGEQIISLLNNSLNTTSDGNYFILKGENFGAISELDSLPPETSLISPINNSGYGTRNISFKYTAADASKVSLCDIYIDNSYISSELNLTNWQEYNINISQLSAGVHLWSVNCYDKYFHQTLSEHRQFTVIPISHFGGVSSNIPLLNLNSVSNFTLEMPSKGKIKFQEPIDLSLGPDIDSFVHIGSDFIEIESSNIPELNKSAILSIYNTSFQHPVILVDGQACTTCTLLNTNNEITFSVPHFTRYVVSENARLHLYDTSDNLQRLAGQSVTIYANYTNITSNTPITGITCTATFADTGLQSMVYNGASLQYEYSRSFSSAGVHSAFISCDGSSLGFTSLNGTEFISIQNPSGRQPFGANVSTIRTSRGPVSAPGNDSRAFAGNISQLGISGASLSQHWQGYFGNVSGDIRLTDASNNVFYNWSNVNPSGEVYATSAFDFNFPTVMCANNSHMIEEQNLIGGNASDVDSVNNTFSSQNHPIFFVGNTQFSPNTCSSIRLYGPNGLIGNSFYEVLLGDGALHVAYTSILEQDTSGFDSGTHDFEMIVGENGAGTDTSATTYYFYLEIE